MLAALRTAKFNPLVSSSRAFSTTRTVAADMAKLVLIGRLVRDPEMRTTKNDKPFVAYTVSTRNSVLNQEGERQYQSTFHRILCFNPRSTESLTRLKGGSKVYVEADYEIREPEPNADSSSPQGQRQIFLKHNAIRVVSQPRLISELESETRSEESEEKL